MLFFRTVTYLDEALNATALSNLFALSSVASLTLSASPDSCGTFLSEDNGTQVLPPTIFTPALTDLTIDTYYMGQFPVIVTLILFVFVKLLYNRIGFGVCENWL